MLALSTVLEPWIPARAPSQWFILNSVCCAWSLGLFLIVLFATDDSAGKQFAKAQYLVYNLITTVLWVSEIGLTVGFTNDIRRQEWAELLVALYFLADSTSVVYKWKMHKEHTSEMGIALFVGFVSYLYVSIDCLKEWRQRRDGFVPVEET